MLNIKQKFLDAKRAYQLIFWKDKFKENEKDSKILETDILDRKDLKQPDDMFITYLEVLLEMKIEKYKMIIDENNYQIMLCIEKGTKIDEEIISELLQENVDYKKENDKYCFIIN